MSGFTLSHRDKWTNPVFRNLLEAGIWGWMCDTAAWRECKIRFNENLVTLNRGELIVSIGFISKGFGIGEQVTRTFLENIEKDGMINKRVTSKGTLITICNYDKYQIDEKAIQQAGNKRLTNAQQAPNNNKNESNEYNKKNTDDACVRESSEIKNQVKEIYGWIEKLFNSAVPLTSAPIAGWLKWGADFELDIKPVAERHKAKNPEKIPRSLAWFDEAIARSIKQRNKPMPDVPPKNSFGESYLNPSAKLQNELLAAMQEKVKQMEKEDEEQSNSSCSSDNNSHDAKLSSAASPQGEGARGINELRT